MKLKKFRAFTLMEIAIALLIIGILAGLCANTINNSSKKKIYNYYLAYRSVEDIASQLILKRDDVDYTTFNINDVFMPKAMAVDARCSNALGYYGMDWDGSKCSCVDSKVPCWNNPKICCTNSYNYSAKSNPTADSYQVGCYATAAFNPTTDSCCPSSGGSVLYNPSTGKCTCYDGYDQVSVGDHGECISAAPASAGSTVCPQGYTYSANVVDKNGNAVGGCIYTALVDASDFCKNVARRMNIVPGSENCSTPYETCTSDSNAKCYKSAYNAAIGSDNIYLSTKVVKGAFKNITPNLVFATGQKVWIPQQKSASIVGLSMSPNDVRNGEQNSCIIDSVNTTSSSCSGAKRNWCNEEARCYQISDNTAKNLTSPISCCKSPEVNWGNLDVTDANKFSDDAPDKNISFAKSGYTILVDIDGDKGTGTLWDDVYPFYIANDGLVYPGYAIGGGAPDASIVGNMSLYKAGDDAGVLPTDVYYYETVSGSRQRTVAFSGVSFARAACLSGKVSPYAPYCLNLSLNSKGVTDLKSSLGTVQDTAEGRNSAAQVIVSRLRSADGQGYNPCTSKICYISVRKRVKLF